MTNHKAAPLARSKPKQTYAQHIEGVSENAQKAAKSVTHYISKEDIAQFFEYTVYQAARFHDLGKLAEENQKKLKTHKKGPLPLDHQDAGVAYFNQNTSTFAISSLIKAHHDELKNYYRERSRLYEGEAHSLAYRSYDPATIDDTEQNLPEYIKTHEEEVPGEEPEEKLQIASADRDVTALLYRLMLSCLVDGDHRDAASKPFSPRPLDHWEKWLSSLKKQMDNEFEKEMSGKKRPLDKKVYTACCEAEIQPLAYCEAPIAIDNIGALMAYALRAANAGKLKHVFVVVQNDACVTLIADTLSKKMALADTESSQIIGAYQPKTKVKDDQGLASLWRAPVIVLSAKEFWKAISANRSSDLRKLREVAGSAILFYDCFFNSPQWQWPQLYRWLQILSETCGCRVLIQASAMAHFWELPLGFGEAPFSILPQELEQELSAFQQGRLTFCFDKNKPIELQDFKDLAPLVIAQPGPRLVVVNTLALAEDFAKALEGKGETNFFITSSQEELQRKMEELKKEESNQSVTLIYTGIIPQNQGFDFAAGFAQLHSVSTLLRVAQLIEQDQGPANLHTFELLKSNALSEEDYISTIPLRKMIKEGKFKNPNFSNLLTEAMHEKFAMEYDPNEATLKRNEENMAFKEVAELFASP